MLFVHVQVYQKQKFEFDQRHPVLLPSSNYFTKLLILYTHDKVCHAYVESTLTELRLKYWIIKGRQTVRKIINPCVTCKKVQGKVLRPPPTPALPEYRVCAELHFQVTSFDFAGPLFVKDIYSKSSDVNKCFILIFTCATSRFTYLELSPDMTSVSFINCFKRFISRCGTPTKVVSDNFKSFKSNETKAYFKEINVTWKPILEKSPWWGGFYERLIAILKSALRKIVGSAKLNFEELHTVLVQIENMMNTRPLTYLSEENCDEHITPSHLMYGRNINRRNIVNDNDNVITLDKTLIKTRIKHVTAVSNHFWNRFYKEYLLSLREQHRYHKNNTKEKRELKINDVVLIQDDKITPRNNYKRGKVEKLIVSRDSKIRGAALHVYNKKKDSTFLLKRPAQKLNPFEIINCVKEDNKNIPYVLVNRSQQNAAVTGQLMHRMKNL